LAHFLHVWTWRALLGRHPGVLDTPWMLSTMGWIDSDVPSADSGRTTDRLDMEILCVLDHDEEGNLTVFVTAY